MRRLTLLALLLLFGFVSVELLDQAVTPGSDQAEIQKMDGPGETPPTPRP